MADGVTIRRPGDPPYPGESTLGAFPTIVLYERMGDGRGLRVALRGLTNHELREVLVGLWATLDQADRVDHIGELAHYRDALAHPDRYPDRFLSPLAEAIRLTVKLAREEDE